MVRVKLLSDHTPVGFCDDMSRGFMECRGIGIINIEELFGIRFVRLEKRIDLVVTFLEDSSQEEPDRTGLDRKTFDLLGVSVPIWKFLFGREEIWPVSWKLPPWFNRRDSLATIRPPTSMKNF